MISQNFKLSDKLPLELDSVNTLIIVFYRGLQPKVLHLKKEFPNSTIVGCSSAGEIYNNHITDEAVISINKFERSSFQVVSHEITNDQSLKAGKNIGESLNAEGLQGVLVFSEGIDVNGSQLTMGIKQKLNLIPIFGGLAGDGTNFQKTSVLHNDEFKTNTVLAIGFYGALEFNSSTGAGWIKFGPDRKVTKSKDNTVFELDQKPALDLYKEYLGKESVNLPASGLFFPLALQTAEGYEITRTILSVNENDKSITLAGDLPQGSNVSLMHADYSELVGGAATCAKDLKNQITDNSFSLAISCVGRRMVLGEYAENELDALHENQDIKNLVGFYSYGEIAPFTNKSNCELHNQTMSLLNITEKK